MHPSQRGKFDIDIYHGFTLVSLLVLNLIQVWEKSHRHCEMGRQNMVVYTDETICLDSQFGVLWSIPTSS